MAAAKKPGNRNYMRGRALEQDIVRKFKLMRWYAIRSAGSKSKVDVVAFSMRGFQTLWIQCKTGSGTLTKTEAADFGRLASEYQCQAVLAHKEHGKGHVELWTIDARGKMEGPFNAEEWCEPGDELEDVEEEDDNPDAAEEALEAEELANAEDDEELEFEDDEEEGITVVDEEPKLEAEPEAPVDPPIPEVDEDNDFGEDEEIDEETW